LHDCHRNLLFVAGRCLGCRVARPPPAVSVSSCEAMGDPPVFRPRPALPAQFWSTSPFWAPFPCFLYGREGPSFCFDLGSTFPRLRTSRSRSVFVFFTGERSFRFCFFGSSLASRIPRPFSRRRRWNYLCKSPFLSVFFRLHPKAFYPFLVPPTLA